MVYYIAWLIICIQAEKLTMHSVISLLTAMWDRAGSVPKELSGMRNELE